MWNCSTSLLSPWRSFPKSFSLLQWGQFQELPRDSGVWVLWYENLKDHSPYLTFLSGFCLLLCAWCFFQLTVSEHNYFLISFILWSVSHKKKELVIHYLFLTIRKKRNAVCLYLSGHISPSFLTKNILQQWKRQFVSLKAEDEQDTSSYIPAF